jgi:hypothetical protein
VGNCQKLGHQLRVRIARKPLAADLLAEVQQLLLGDAPFHEGARVDAGGAVALDVQQVATVPRALGMPEVVEAGSQHVRQRLERADVAAQVAHRRLGVRLALTTIAIAFQRM